MKEGVFRTDRRIIETAGDRVNRRGLSFGIFEHEAFESVHDALFSEGYRRRVITQFLTASQGLDPDDLARIAKEGGEGTDRVAPPADARADHVGKESRRFLELFARLESDARLEIAHHHGEGVRPQRGTDAVDGVFIVFSVRFESGVDRFFQGAQAAFHADDFRAENLHSRNVRRLLRDIDFPHVDFTFQSEMRGGSRERDPMLTCARLGDETFLAQVFRQQPFSHAVIEFVRSGMVQVFAFQVDLACAVAELSRKIFAMSDRGRTSLEIASNLAQFFDETRGETNCLVRFGNFVKRFLQLRGEIGTAISSESSVLARIFFQIIGEIHFQLQKWG